MLKRFSFLLIAILLLAISANNNTATAQEAAQKTTCTAKQDKSKKAFLGVYLYEEGEKADQKANQGVLIKDVVANGSAAAAGIQAGDIIKTMNGTEITDHASLKTALQGLKPGDKLELSFWRAGETMTAATNLKAYGDFPEVMAEKAQKSTCSKGKTASTCSKGKAASTCSKGKTTCSKSASAALPNKAHLGVRVRTINEELVALKKLTATTGLYVDKVVENSAAAAAGIQVGDIITAVNGQEVADRAALKKQLSTAKVGDALDISFLRAGEATTASAKLQARPAAQSSCSKSKSGCSKSASSCSKSKADCPKSASCWKTETVCTGKDAPACCSKIVCNNKNAPACCTKDGCTSKNAPACCTKACTGKDAPACCKTKTVCTKSTASCSKSASSCSKSKAACSKSASSCSKSKAACSKSASSCSKSKAACCSGGKKYPANKVLLGVNVGEVCSKVAEKNKMEKAEGVYIKEITAEGAAAKAGLQKGDVITFIGKSAIKNYEGLHKALATYEPGKKAKITYIREGKTSKAKAKLVANPNYREVQIMDTNQKDAAILKDMIAKNEAFANLKDMGILEVKGLTFFPNPNDGRFTLSFDAGQEAETAVRIIDLTGKIVYQNNVAKEAGKYTEQIDISQNNKGFYLIQIMQNNKVLTKKISVQ